jgi:competence CoiA-like predicted nuclease
MGLKALSNNEEIISVQIEKTKWFLLKKDIEFKNTLTMACCKSKAIMKNSHLGLQYFAHAKRDNCFSKPESIEHITAKAIAYNIAIQLNWNAKLEYSFVLPHGNQIITDLYLEKDDIKIAFEFQISNQSLRTMKERTEKYKLLGIPVIWFNSFDNKTYNYSIEKFNTFYQVYKLKISKEDRKLNFECNNSSFENFLNEKLCETSNRQIFTNIYDWITIDDDEFIRLNKDLNSSTIQLSRNWRGFTNGFYFDHQDDINTHLFEGLNIQGFRVTPFQVPLYYDEIKKFNQC